MSGPETHLQVASFRFQNFRFCQPLAEDARWELRVTDVTPNKKAGGGTISNNEAFVGTCQGRWGACSFCFVFSGGDVR